MDFTTEELDIMVKFAISRRPDQIAELLKTALPILYSNGFNPVELLTALNAQSARLENDIASLGTYVALETPKLTATKLVIDGLISKLTP